MSRESIKEAGGTPAAEQNRMEIEYAGLAADFLKKKTKNPGAYPRIR